MDRVSLSGHKSKYKQLWIKKNLFTHSSEFIVLKICVEIAWVNFKTQSFELIYSYFT